MIRPADSTDCSLNTVRCAIYTRKSVTEGLDQEYNSLDAQREAGENFIASQKERGWVCLPDRYDDGGFSGGNLDRPALTRLLQDIEGGRVDCVVVYKVDRLSRSLPDFARLVEIFDKHGVIFVSVTQPFNTGDSAGRLMLNVLSSFAEYERQTIADRTRDKMSAARRKGKYTGGTVPLGFYADNKKLEIDRDEAQMVQQIFSLYLEKQSLNEVAEELNRRGWRTKSRTSKNGRFHEGRRFSKGYLQRLLKNTVYVGQVRHRGKIYEGEHEGIIDPQVFGEVQALLTTNGSNGGSSARNKYGFLLRGLLRCAHCGSAMTPTSSRKGNRVYRYYRCSGRHKGSTSCPTRSVSAEKIERLVVDQIRRIGEDPDLIRETARQVKEATKEKKAALVAEQRRLKRELSKKQTEAHRLVDTLTTGRVKGSTLTDRLTDLEEQIARQEGRLTEIQGELTALKDQAFSQADLTKVLGLFDPIWDVLYPVEKERIARLLIKQVDYCSGNGKLGLKFRLTGLKSLSSEFDSAKG